MHGCRIYQCPGSCLPSPLSNFQAKKEELEQQYEATVADLERERQLNETMRLSTAVLEKLQVTCDGCRLP